jgi:hypothetical protein
MDLSRRRMNGAAARRAAMVGGYGIFDSALYRNRVAEWLFHQEKATLHDATMSICELNNAL